MLERTLILLKPDALQRSLVGEIIKRIERVGFILRGIKMVRATEDQLTRHYNKDDAWYQKKGDGRVQLLHASGKPIDPNRPAVEYGKDIIRNIVKYMTVSPLVAMVWEGNQAVGIVKKIVGGTEPLSSDVGTIRGDLTLDSYSLSDTEQRGIRNLVHCSDNPEDAVREIALWFKPEELFDYRHIIEEMLYDVDLDGLRE